MDRYKNRGVSSKKEDVHNALKSNMDRGIFNNTFCKIVKDVLCNDSEYCNIMHADGAGTKSSLAYLYYKETGDLNIFKGIVKDAVVMNIDDLICVGASDNFLLSNTIGRNSKYITGEIIQVIIHEFQHICEWFNKFGINMVLTGGETADAGDIVRTLILDSTITTRLKISDIIDNSKIKPGNLIVGLASDGKTIYEDDYNSGIGSNGLTSARHDVFAGKYKNLYPETYCHDMPEELIYCGSYEVLDIHPDLPYNIGKAVLSPTRTYAPVIKTILDSHRKRINGMVHCTGGGQTKCLGFGENLHYFKNNLFEIPPIFKIIKQASNTSFKEMYQVFNMGHRMEIFTDQSTAENIIDICKNFNLDARIIGEVKDSDNGKNKLTIISPDGEIKYNS